MEDLTKNFNRSEFACKGKNCCGGAAPVSLKLVQGLQALRDAIGRPLTVNSGFRCLKHNGAVGGAKSSRHCLGTAADVALPKGFDAMRLAALAQGLELFDGIGLYDTFVHFDVRGVKARWDYRVKK